MTSDDGRYFREFAFSSQQLELYYGAARRDLEIASGAAISEVKFKFAYDALLKLAVFSAARRRRKVRSAPGHHIALLEFLASEVAKPGVFEIADEMRRKRNLDTYQGGAPITEKESEDYYSFTKEMFESIEPASI